MFLGVKVSVCPFEMWLEDSRMSLGNSSSPVMPFGTSLSPAIILLTVLVSVPAGVATVSVTS